MNNLFSAYNSTEDFRVLICAPDMFSAEIVSREYAEDIKLDGEFEIKEYDIENGLKFDCDYVLI